MVGNEPDVNVETQGKTRVFSSYRHLRQSASVCVLFNVPLEPFFDLKKKSMLIIPHCFFLHP